MKALSRKNQNDQKGKFQESIYQQLSWNKEVDGHKKRFLSSKKKVTNSKVNTKIEINLPTLMNQSSQDS